MAIGDSVLTSDEIRAEQVSILAGELEELREWVSEVQKQVGRVRDCLVTAMTDRQYEEHMWAGGGKVGCLRILLTMIEKA
jgi:hypothetical protein